MIKLNPQDKFFIEDDEGSLILASEIILDLDMVKNNMMFIRGKKFNVNYEDSLINEDGLVECQLSFTLDGYSRIDENGKYVD